MSPKGVYERTPKNKPKPRAYPPEIVALACELYESGMTVAEIRAVFPKGYKVQRILERHLPERRAQARRDQRGERNHMWKTEPGYGAAHLRLTADQGPASTHACVDCGEGAREWSYVGGCPDQIGGLDRSPYCLHAHHYQPRCARCHRSYDFKGRRPNGQMMSRQEVMSYV